MRNYFEKKDEYHVHDDIASILMFGSGAFECTLSYVVPTYHRTDLLEECIKSIITQATDIPFEIIIVDNDPNHMNRENPVYALIEKFDDARISYYVNEKNIGASGNWNRCFSLARGKYVCMVHDDDAVNKNHCQIMIDAIKSNDDIDFTTCLHATVDTRANNGKTLFDDCIRADIVKPPTAPRLLNYKRQITQNYTPLLGTVFRKTCLIDSGGFKAVDAEKFEDYIFISKCLYYYAGYEVSSELYVYRIQDNDSLNYDMWEEIITKDYYLGLYIAKAGNNSWIHIHRLNYFTARKMFGFNTKWKNECIAARINEKHVQGYCKIPRCEWLFYQMVLTIKNSVGKTVKSISRQSKVSDYENKQ